jgi:DNA-directed RNA polymerase subunit RPC12/RpoP
VQVNVKNLIGDVRCYQTAREWYWTDGVQCPSCESQHAIKRGFDDKKSVKR